MLDGIDTNVLGVGLIALATGAFTVYWYGRRLGHVWLSRAGTIAVFLILIGLVVLLGSANIDD